MDSPALESVDRLLIKSPEQLRQDVIDQYSWDMEGNARYVNFPDYSRDAIRKMLDEKYGQIRAMIVMQKYDRYCEIRTQFYDAAHFTLPCANCPDPLTEHEMLSNGARICKNPKKQTRVTEASG